MGQRKRGNLSHQETRAAGVWAAPRTVSRTPASQSCHPVAQPIAGKAGICFDLTLHFKKGSDSTTLVPTSPANLGRPGRGKPPAQQSCESLRLARDGDRLHVHHGLYQRDHGEQHPLVRSRSWCPFPCFPSSQQSVRRASKPQRSATDRQERRGVSLVVPWIRNVRPTKWRSSCPEVASRKPWGWYPFLPPPSVVGQHESPLKGQMLRDIDFMEGEGGLQCAVIHPWAVLLQPHDMFATKSEAEAACDHSGSVPKLASVVHQRRSL